MHTKTIFLNALLLGLLATATGCGHGPRLADAERAKLPAVSAIHVLHYDTPLPELRSPEKSAPTAAAIRRTVAADPAAQVTALFVRLLARQEKLRNLQTPQPITRPVATNAREFRSKLNDGLVLELWVDDWTFSPAPADAKSYVMHLTARARLSRLTDGKILWQAEGCRVASGRDPKLTLTDLTQGTRLRKALTSARDECAHQLLRDFSQRRES